MAELLNIVDDLRHLINSSRTVYTVKHPPYESGSVTVYVHGMLQNFDFWTELDPVAGTVELGLVLLEDTVENSHGLAIAYNSYALPYVDPRDPKHISELVIGDVVRIAMSPGRQLTPTVVRGVPQLVPVPVPRTTRASQRTVVVGRINNNDPTSGTMTLDVEDTRTSTRRSIFATVPYASILFIRKFITPDDAPTVRAQPRGFMQLIRVYF